MASGSKKSGESAKEKRDGFDLDEFQKVVQMCVKEDSSAFLEEVKTWSPDEEGKLFVEEMQREIELRKETEQFAEMEMKKKLRSMTPKDFRRKSYNEGDQSPLVGRDAWILHWQWSQNMDYLKSSSKNCFASGNLPD